MEEEIEAMRRMEFCVKTRCCYSAVPCAAKLGHRLVVHRDTNQPLARHIQFTKPLNSSVPVARFKELFKAVEQMKGGGRRQTITVLSHIVSSSSSPLVESNLGDDAT